MSSYDVGSFKIELTDPTNFSASKGTYSQYIKLKWNLVPYAQYYYIYRSPTNRNYYSYYTTVYTNFYEDYYVYGDVTYYYKVQAGIGSTASGFSLDDYGFISLPKPSGLSVSKGNYNYIYLNWEYLQDADVYYIYRSSDGTNFSYLNTTAYNYYYDYVTEYNYFYYKIIAYDYDKRVYSDYSDLDYGWIYNP